MPWHFQIPHGAPPPPPPTYNATIINTTCSPDCNRLRCSKVNRNFGTFGTLLMALADRHHRGRKQRRGELNQLLSMPSAHTRRPAGELAMVQLNGTNGHASSSQTVSSARSRS